MQGVPGSTTVASLICILAATSIAGCLEVNYHAPADAGASQEGTHDDAAPGEAPVTPPKERAPALGLISDSAGSSTSRWTVKVSSASSLVDLPAVQFVFSTPSSGPLVARSDTASFESGIDECWHVPDQDSSRKESRSCTGGPEFRITWTDIGGDGRLSVGDTIVFDYESTPAQTEYSDTFPAGAYSLEILHTPTGTSAGSLPRTF